MSDRAEGVVAGYLKVASAVTGFERARLDRLAGAPAVRGDGA
jgi:hypothetical protein